MSLLDELRGMEEQVRRRLRELEPLVGEYQELQEVARRLGVSAAPEQSGQRSRGSARTRRTSSTARRAANPPKSRTTSKPKGGRTSGRRAQGEGPAASSAGARQQQIAELVAANPGITVRELGGKLGVDPTGLYRPVRRLEQAGKVRKEGATLHPA
jgi:hypothetical protein